MRQYRLLEITTQYDQYLREFYNYHKDIEQWSYDELFSLLVADAFAESDFIHRELNQMGIESKVIFYNNRTLQGKWKGSKNEMSYFEILLLQIKDFKPDVILISDMNCFTGEEIKNIKNCQEPKKIKLLGYHFTALSDTFKKRASLYDQIYTGSKTFVNNMKGCGLPAYLLRHAFEPSILNHVVKKEIMNKICFLGTVILGENVHENRIEMFRKLIVENIPYDFYGNIYGAPQKIVSNNDDQGKSAMEAEIINGRKPGMFGINYYTAMSQYSICLNLHALCGDSYSAGNMRMFEATGMGICLLTDHKGENAELFDVNKEIVVYESFDDMIQKAKWLLDHPQKGREIAIAGQKRTFKEHTYKNKAVYLNEYIQMLLA